jgi:DNA-binding NtrC family response regulator
MESFGRARVIVVASRDCGRSLAQSLSRMGLAGVRIVDSPQEAQVLCQTNRADGCLVMLPREVPDEIPTCSAESEAPGRAAGVPSLLVADVVTPHVARSARNSGYFATIPTGIPPRMLYRTLRALLQRRQRSASKATSENRGRAASAALDAVSALSSQGWAGGKFKLQ